MKAEITYNIRRAGGDGKPWELYRDANVFDRKERGAGCLPSVVVAQFTSEEEANLFGFWLNERQDG